MKILILDSGPLINLSMNGLLDILGELKVHSSVRIVISSAVKYETVDRPSHIPKYELGALRVQQLIREGILELPESLGIDQKRIDSLSREYLHSANHYLQAKGRWIDIVSEAEISCLALATILRAQNHEVLIAIDERTMRLLAENPRALVGIMSSRLHQPIVASGNLPKEFKKMNFIRSTELAYVAWKKKLLHLDVPDALEAVLYATKFHGSAVSMEEIEALKRK